MIVFASMLLAVPMAAASSPPPPPPIPPGSTGASWAYGHLWQWNNSAINSIDTNESNITADLHESGSIQVGSEVIYIETNTSGGEMIQTYSAVTLAASFSATYSETEGTTTVSASVNFQGYGWYVVQNYLNLTNSGVVYIGGVAEPGVALENAATNVQLNMTMSFSVSESGYGGSTAYSASGYFSAQALGKAMADFSPALGLFPADAANLTTGTVWNSSSTYTASGSISAGAHEFESLPAEYFANATCPVGYQASGSNCVFSATNSTTITPAVGTGTITLYGSDLGSFPINTTTPGQSQQVQELQIWTDGPYGVTDGLVFVPSGLLGTGPGGTPLGIEHTLVHTLQATPNDNFYYNAQSTTHLGVVGASESVTGSGSTVLAPQSPQVAESAVVTNLAAAQPSPSSSSGGLPIMLILVVAVVAVVAILGVLVWSGRRKRKPIARAPMQPQQAQPGMQPMQQQPAPQYPPAQQPYQQQGQPYQQQGGPYQQR